MVLQGSVKWIQYTLIVLNFLVMVAGVGSVGLGVWSMTARYGSDKISDLTDSHIYRLMSILVIAGGCLTLIIGLLGFRCILTEDRRFMISHFIAMVCLLLFFVTVTTLAFVNTKNLKEELSKQLEKTLTENYNVGTENEDVTNDWDTMQQELQCCGVEGNITEGRSWFIWQSSLWFLNQQDVAQYVPDSCCDTAYILFKCGFLSNMTEESAKRNHFDFIKEHPALYTTGCLNKIIDRIQDKLQYIIGGLAGIIAVKFLCAVVSITLFAVIVLRGYDEKGEDE